MRLFIDSRQVFDYIDFDLLSGPGHQAFGFENNSGNTVEIRNVVVYYRPMPVAVSPLVIASRFCELGDFESAMTQLKEIVETHPHSQEAQKAQYRIAVCLDLQGDSEAALRAYMLFEHEANCNALVPASMSRRLLLLERLGRTSAADRTLLAMLKRFPGHPVIRSEFYHLSSALYGALPGHTALMMNVRKYRGLFIMTARKMRALSCRFGLDSSTNPYLFRMADTVYMAGLYRDAVKYFGDQSPAAGALIDLGHAWRVADNPLYSSLNRAGYGWLSGDIPRRRDHGTLRLLPREKVKRYCRVIRSSSKTVSPRC